MLRFFCVVAMCFLVSACSDPKKASESNFKKSIQAYLDATYPVCYLKSDFPYELENNSWGHNKNELMALEKIGLLSSQEKEVIKEGLMWKGPVKVTVFDLTDEGEKHYVPASEDKSKKANTGGFCFGKAEVKDISQFSEPADAMGHKISRVDYTFVVSDIPKWARSEDFLKSFYPSSSGKGPLQEAIDSDKNPIQRKHALVLTNNGWIHEKLYK